MIRCKKCVMPDTKPGVVLDDEGICQACRHAAKKAKINWDNRMDELKKLCDKYRGINGDYYDCIITVSGGKDSHFQVYIMKEVMKMNPLLVNVDNFSWTETGRHNYYNMSDAFGCDILSLSLNRKIARKMLRKAFERLGSPTWYWDRAVYVYPIRIAINMNIPLIVYGENVAVEYGGVQKEESYSAKDQINNDVVKPVNLEEWIDDDIKMKDLYTCVYPTKEEIEKSKLEPIYLSYFVPWDGYKNYQIAKKYGFKSLGDTGEWKREGYIEDYDQIDALGYLVHPWLKYPKFGFSRSTDVCCYWIRSGKISRKEAIKLVEENDPKLVDPKALKDFLEFTGYTEEEFWTITEKFINPKVWEKIGEHEWKLKDSETEQILKIPL